MDLDTTGFGAFQVTTHTDSTVESAAATDITVNASGGAQFGFIAQASLEGYVESITAVGVGLVAIYDFSSGSEQVRALADAPSHPDPPVGGSSRTGASGDKPLIDVDIFI